MNAASTARTFSPDPFALQISALILHRRACCLELPEEISDELLKWAARFAKVSRILQEKSDRENPFDPDAEEVPSAPEVAFADDAFVCLMQRVAPSSVGLEIRHYRLVRKGAEQDSKLSPRPVSAGAIAVLDLIQHERKNWEVYHAEVVPRFRRHGLMSRLFAHHEVSAQTELVAPSGWITDDGREFWMRRRPDITKHHVQLPEFPGLWTSPKQLMCMNFVLQMMLMEEAETDLPN